MHVQQDNYRNQIIQLDLLLTIGTFCSSLFGAVGAAFGMNIPSGLESNDYAFYLVVALGAVLSFAVFFVILKLLRKRSLV